MRLTEDVFDRLDNTDDSIFYSMDRFVNHLDSRALETVEDWIGQLITEDSPVILDLMAGWDSHIPATVEPSRVVGLGLNKNEMRSNKDLSAYVIHDINMNPQLPFDNGMFDVVLCTVSIDYITHPQRVFTEVGRVLKPGGLFLVIFSNRWFPPKVVKVWRESSEAERVLLVEEYFRDSGVFERTYTMVSKGKPRPEDDKYAYLGIPSDPVYAVYANRKGAKEMERKLEDKMAGHKGIEKDTLDERKASVKDTLCCPYCGTKLERWQVPQTLFTEWPNEFMYVCFNDECSYFVEGWNAMSRQGNPCSYRLMYDPVNDGCQPVPVFNNRMLRDGILQEG
ncbi:MAG: methyltransferase domain-containing protein [Dehalococcoidia bacterium]